MAIGLGLSATATAQVNNLCDQPGEAPDLITGDIVGGAFRWGSVGGITGYSIGTEICNVGTCWLNFSGPTASHPILG